MTAENQAPKRDVMEQMRLNDLGEQLSTIRALASLQREVAMARSIEDEVPKWWCDAFDDALCCAIRQTSERGSDIIEQLGGEL